MRSQYVVSVSLIIFSACSGGGGRSIFNSTDAPAISIELESSPADYFRQNSQSITVRYLTKVTKKAIADKLVVAQVLRGSRSLVESSLTTDKNGTAIFHYPVETKESVEIEFSVEDSETGVTLSEKTNFTVVADRGLSPFLRAAALRVNDNDFYYQARSVRIGSLANGHRVAAEGISIAYGAWSQIRLIDLDQNPDALVTVGQLPAFTPDINGGAPSPSSNVFPDSIWNLEFYQNYLLVAGGGIGFAIVNIQNPAAPTLSFAEGTYTLGNPRIREVQWIERVGDRVYVIDRITKTVRVYRLTNMVSPTLERTISFPTGYFPSAMRVVGNRAYFTDYYKFFFVFDLTTNTVIKQIAGSGSCNYAQDIKYLDGYAYVSSICTSGKIYDLRSPSNPKKLGEYFDSQGPNRSYPVGNFVYVVEPGAISKFDISNKNLPRKVATFNSGGSAMDIAFSQDKMYVADSPVILLEMDLKNPSRELQPLSSAYYGGMARRLAQYGNRLYVANYDGGYTRFTAFQLNSGGVPVALGTSPVFPGYPYSIRATNGKVAVSTEASNGGVFLFNVSNPASITQIGNILIHSTTLNDSIGCNRDASMVVVDCLGSARDAVFDPANPNRLYAAIHYPVSAGSQTPNFISFDITNPGAIKVLSSVLIPGSVAWKIIVQGTRAFVSGFWQGVQVVNLATPTALSLLTTTNSGYYDTSLDATQNVIVDGDFIYAADGTGGIQVLNANNLPATHYLSLVQTVEMVPVAQQWWDRSLQLSLLNDRLFVLGSSGMAIYKIGDDGLLTFETLLNIRGAMEDFLITEDRIVGADGWMGVETFNIPQYFLEN